MSGGAEKTKQQKLSDEIAEPPRLIDRMYQQARGLGGECVEIGGPIEIVAVENEELVGPQSLSAAAGSDCGATLAASRFPLPAGFDSASAMVRATASALEGKPFPLLGTMPAWLRPALAPVGTLINRVPTGAR